MIRRCFVKILFCLTLGLASCSLNNQTRDVFAQERIGLSENITLSGPEFESNEKQYRETVMGLYQEQVYPVRLSVILIIICIVLLLFSLTVIFLLRQNKKLRRINLELSRSREGSDELKINNIKIELRTREAEKNALRTELESKENALASKLLSLSRANEFLKNLRKQIARKRKRTKGYEKKKYLNELFQETSKHLNNNIWQEFELLFASGNCSFIVELSKVHSDLTLNDKRLCYLILTGLNTKEIAIVMSKSYRSVEMGRHRLREKLGLTPQEDLNNYLLQFHYVKKQVM